MIEADVGDHGDRRIGHVGRIPATTQADLDHGDIHRPIGEPTERRRSDQLEPTGAHLAHHRLDGSHPGQRIGQIGVVDGLPVDTDPLVDPLQVGTGEGAHGQAFRHEQPGQGPRRRRLAIRSRDMEDRHGALGIAEDIDQPAHAGQVGAGLGRVGQHALEVLMTVEPLQRVAQFHGYA